MKVELAKGIVKVKVDKIGKSCKNRMSDGRRCKEECDRVFCNNYDVIAYNLADMKGVSREVIKHRLNMKKEIKLVKQKKKNFAPDR